MRVWNFLRQWVDDSPMVVLVVAFLLVLFVEFAPMYLQGVAGQPTVSAASLFNDYDHALADAAVKKPGYIRPLSRIDPSKPEVRVTTFRFPSLATGKQQLKNAIWVSLPEELKAACAGMRDATRGMQQILGLPPTAGPRAVYEITAQSSDLVRPCLSSGDTGKGGCSFDFPLIQDPHLDPPSPTATPAEKDMAYTALRNAYDPLRADYERVWFLANQMWNSYRDGFQADYVTKGDYPYNGYPFTGMGWTYNWNPQSVTHFGVSEFVIPTGKWITVERQVPPEEFCAVKR